MIPSHKIIITLCFGFALTFPQYNVNAYCNNYKEVTNNKVWTIKFNKNIDFNKLSKDNITVKDVKGNFINCSISLGHDASDIEVNPPENGYTLNEKYTLTITKQAYPHLNQEKSINFTIKKEVINTQNFPDEPSWDDSLILTFNGHKYNVTSETTNDVYRIIEYITYHGNDGRVFKIYSINNIDNYDKIAIKTKNGYLVAIVSID